jgi:hypothetical protein
MIFAIRNETRATYCVSDHSSYLNSGPLSANEIDPYASQELACGVVFYLCRFKLSQRSQNYLDTHKILGSLTWGLLPPTTSQMQKSG